jgi:hypothetical protein
MPNIARNRPQVRSIRSARLNRSKSRRILMQIISRIVHLPNTHHITNRISKSSGYFRKDLFCLQFLCLITCHCRKTKRSAKKCFNCFSLNMNTYLKHKRKTISDYRNEHNKIINKTKTYIRKTSFKED